MLFRQLHSNVTLSILGVVEEQLANSRLDALHAAKSARYDAGNSTEIVRRQCTPNTRVSILNDLKHWANSNGGPRIYWMNGMAGTGKTTIATSFCADLENSHKLAASFFCARSLPECREVARVVPTISYHLARFSYPVQASICRIIGDDPDIISRSILVQFKKLVVEPLVEVANMFPINPVVVLDALDELSDRHGAQVILNLLLQFAPTLPIKFFVTCRPEPGLFSILKSLHNESTSVFHLHDIEESIVQSDIETYLQEELNGLSVSLEDIGRLAHRSGKLFIYAATIVRYIRPNGLSVSPRKRLVNLLFATPGSYNKSQTDIDALYDAILGATFGVPALENLEKHNIRLALYTVVCAKEPMSLRVISEFLELDMEDEVIPALESLQSVLNISCSSLVTPIHASFPEYILDSSRSGQFFCDEAEHSCFLARRCFDIMKKFLRFNICDLDSSFVPDIEIPDLAKRIEAAIPPHLSYSCRYWGDHMNWMVANDEIFSMVETFVSGYLLFWMEVLNLTRQINRGSPLLSSIQTWLQASALSLS
ncbi:Vegetative incompatibility protein HET-E-1 [Ceratobasidium sp. AG-Ba]|nr:Vegetative incompatibility protein HET-E-1 [Ceratobasidium sp. AG-Ba]